MLNIDKLIIIHIIQVIKYSKRPIIDTTHGYELSPLNYLIKTINFSFDLKTIKDKN